MPKKTCRYSLIQGLAQVVVNQPEDDYLGNFLIDMPMHKKEGQDVIRKANMETINAERAEIEKAEQTAAAEKQAIWAQKQRINSIGRIT